MMITFGFTIEVEGILAESSSERAMNRITKTIHEEIGEILHGKFLPRHFQPNAGTRYGYKSRSAGTRAIRRRQVQQRRAVASDTDLVKTGKTRDRATGYGVVRGYPRRGEVTFYVPSYIKRRKSGMPDLEKELQTVAADEQREIRQYAEKRIVQLIQQNRTRRTRKG